MQLSIALLALIKVSTALTARAAEKLFTVEFAPGDIQTVTEEEKWTLKEQHKNFIDITDLDKTPAVRPRAAVNFPINVTQTKAVRSLLPKLSQDRIQQTLTKFTAFHNRYYDAVYGQQSAEWLLDQIETIILASGAPSVNVTTFKHAYKQPSIIATIPGKSAKTIVVGAHQDSLNLFERVTGRAPGADDNGSGAMTTLEAFRILLTDSRIASGQAPNTIEFHWYAGEEAGLLGSGAIFQAYARQGRDVKAMLNQDMTGYVKPDTKEVIGIITDYVDFSLTSFLKKVITAYSVLPFVETECGYGCSDHASATRSGYPSAFAVESSFEDSSPVIHTPSDTLDTVNFGHMLEFAKIVVGFAYELGFANL